MAQFLNIEILVDIYLNKARYPRDMVDILPGIFPLPIFYAQRTKKKEARRKKKEQ